MGPMSGWLKEPTQYDAEGYAIIPEVNTWGENPYLQGAQETIGNAVQGLQTSQGRMGSLQGQMASMSQGGGYPAMANDYGLGDTSSAFPGAASNPSYAQSPITTGGTDNSSRGFNPWSLTGEALSR